MSAMKVLESEKHKNSSVPGADQPTSNTLTLPCSDPATTTSTIGVSSERRPERRSSASENPVKTIWESPGARSRRSRREEVPRAGHCCNGSPPEMSDALDRPLEGQRPVDKLIHRVLAPDQRGVVSS